MNINNNELEQDRNDQHIRTSTSMASGAAPIISSGSPTEEHKATYVEQQMQQILLSRGE